MESSIWQVLRAMKQRAVHIRSPSSKVACRRYSRSSSISHTAIINRDTHYPTRQCESRRAGGLSGQRQLGLISAGRGRGDSGHSSAYRPHSCYSGRGVRLERQTQQSRRRLKALWRAGAMVSSRCIHCRCCWYCTRVLRSSFFSSMGH